MRLQDLFRDQNTRPKAIATSLLIGGVLLYGAYHFWIQRKEVGDRVVQCAHTVGVTLKDVSHNVVDATKSAGHKIDDKIHILGKEVKEVANKVESKIEETLFKISHTLPSAKERIAAFKKLHLERFFKAEHQAIAEEQHKTLSIEALSLIQQLAIEMSEQNFRQLTAINREQRRKLIQHHKAQYEQVVIGGQKDFEEIFTQNMDEILKACKVPRDKYNDSMAEHVATDPNVYLVDSQLHDIMIGRLPAVNAPMTPSKDYAIEVYTFMVGQYPKIMWQPVHKPHYTEVREKMLFDKIHEKFQLEEEDIRKLKSDFEGVELANLVEKYNSLIIEDEKKHGDFPKV